MRMMSAKKLAILQLVVTWFTLSVPTGAMAEEKDRIRVLSYNIHHGQGVDGRLDLERIAEVILSVKPDLVALQEVDQKASRSRSVDQPAELARRTKMNVAFGGNIDLQGGKYGNAVLSRFPIVRHQNHLLPNMDDGEQRGVLETEIKIPQMKQSLVLLATHLDHRRGDKERVASAQAINDLIAKHSERPALLAGDLNDVLESDTLTRLETVWTPANGKPLPTIPVATPTKQIDFVLFHPQRRWKIVEVKVLDEAVASDHRAILAILELQPGKTHE